MESLRGQLLVAAPDLLDPNFYRSVVLIVQHNEDGALGLILNRPTETPLSQVWDQVSDSVCESEQILYSGGPCEGPLMVLHTDPERSQISVSDDLHFSAEPSDVEWMVEQAGADHRFFVGCAGWAPGQLENELAAGSWVVAEARTDHVFNSATDQWVRIAHEIADARLLAPLGKKHQPIDPRLN